MGKRSYLMTLYLVEHTCIFKYNKNIENLQINVKFRFYGCMVYGNKWI